MSPLAEPATRRVTSTSHHVLIVEDEVDLAQMLEMNLVRDGYSCDMVHSGDEALTAIRKRRPDLVILDRMLPELSGDDVLASIRGESELAPIPVVMLTAKAEDSDQLTGFELGADDYVTKPFAIKVLLARIASVIRRSKAADPQDRATLQAGPIRLDASRHEIRVDGEQVNLTATEFRLLQALMKANGRVLSRSQLLDSAFGLDVVVSDRTIDVHITSLRKKMTPAGNWIRTVRGVGYALRHPENT